MLAKRRHVNINTLFLFLVFYFVVLFGRLWHLLPGEPARFWTVSGAIWRADGSHSARNISEQECPNWIIRQFQSFSPLLQDCVGERERDRERARARARERYAWCVDQVFFRWPHVRSPIYAYGVPTYHDRHVIVFHGWNKIISKDLTVNHIYRRSTRFLKGKICSHKQPLAYLHTMDVWGGR